MDEVTLICIQLLQSSTKMFEGESWTISGHGLERGCRMLKKSDRPSRSLSLDAALYTRFSLFELKAQCGRFSSPNSNPNCKKAKRKHS